MIQDALRPAAREAVATWVEFLMSRYRGRPDSPAFSLMDKQMWLAVIGHWPVDVLQAAVTQWCAEDRPFAPSVPGELKALGEPIYNARRSLNARAQELLRGPDQVARDYVSADDLATLRARLGRGSGIVIVPPVTIEMSDELAQRFRDGSWPQRTEDQEAVDG
ncbi:hypothetical protein [Vitreimonas flagellata]|uniref:hypothetical protein n=1 Tax=Vitreimonas flagellata TaxID=2560861 RepID=UPI001431C05D|nr:hypothetical protein [Vitreimonas flagellata]